MNVMNASFFEEYVKNIYDNQKSAPINIKFSISVVKTFLKKLEKSTGQNLPPNFYHLLFL